MTEDEVKAIDHEIMMSEELISRDEVITLCKVLHDLEWWQSCDSSEEDYRKTVAKFKEKWFQYSRNSEWIPVSERLPENNVIVLCSAISTSISGGYTRFVGCCNNGFWFVQTDAETLSYPRQYEVTAWQPLPEPYKAESED